MEELNLYKCADGDMGAGHHPGAHISGHGGRQCLVRGDGETSLIRNGGRPVETEQRCPLIPHKVSVIYSPSLEFLFNSLSFYGPNQYT